MTFFGFSIILIFLNSVSFLGILRENFFTWGGKASVGVGIAVCDFVEEIYFLKQELVGGWDV
jgi:hypothetical protein